MLYFIILNILRLYYYEIKLYFLPLLQPNFAAFAMTSFAPTQFDRRHCRSVSIFTVVYSFVSVFSVVVLFHADSVNGIF